MSDSEIIHLALGPRSYDIHVGGGLLDQAGALAAPLLKSPNAIIITDENVGPLYMERLQESLTDAGIECPAIVIPAGEQTKDFHHFEELLNTLLDMRIERSSTLIALGGGVIGDLTGFAASVILRGVDFIQVPTTLLAQVDSSVGGKTGIDTAHGKNLVGAFYQPRLVIADLDTLDTLPAGELRAGYAETVKYGLIDDPDFFAWLEDAGAALLKGDADARRRAVAHSCRAKAAIVAEDEREGGRRALLNLGHTFGHALETQAGFSGALLHGEAVAIGCVMAFDLSARLGFCPAIDAARVRAHYEALHLPTEPPTIQGVAWNAEQLLEHMTADKKAEGGAITFILARAIGEAFIAKDVDPGDVRAILSGGA
ncbi:MAG: 3-dehydroquinate synthase [Rhodospirillaceae bacterium]|nr:3-dehydroquinate synthase [Rhodospirillaceae bacterium]MBT3886181.1 3-dehydroquinate synthase [Rhodospirillaceae bacterium]MBT4116696.1 3-dehydroquinate synthase [Rhodospirillaceae bacterium]MBT4671524.1 3-dehydroquinate synthase [Rhodospirillaceae bacterium]MBT4718988.1 3-dehydroquinate synthase [Rhodospirillaceae bacterium]